MSPLPGLTGRPSGFHSSSLYSASSEPLEGGFKQGARHLDSAPYPLNTHTRRVFFLAALHGIQDVRPGIELVPPAVGGWSLNCWTTTSRSLVLTIQSKLLLMTSSHDLPAPTLCSSDTLLFSPPASGPLHLTYLCLESPSPKVLPGLIFLLFSVSVQQASAI